MTGDANAYFVVALVAIGMAISFLTADPKTPSSRALASMLGFLGVAIFLNAIEDMRVLAGPAFWQRLSSVCEAGALIGGLEWLRRVGRTADRHTPGDLVFRVAQGLGVVYAALGVALPELRLAVADPGWNARVFREPGFYLFAVPFYLALALPTRRMIELLRGELDPSERVRVVAFVAAIPFLVSGLILSPPLEIFTTTIGELVFLAGAVRYHVLQGQRGQFLARFLSPQVASLVRERGVATTLQQNRLQLSVVSCDLRGFTAFSESAAPEDVIQLLRDYYATVGEVVTAFHGTIKDFAGDGVLVLVGAPLPLADHADRAVAMALAVRERGETFLQSWRRIGIELGLGVGVATGFATVGAISGGDRLEYAAVGPVVNLAARLGERAENGQVLVDPRTVGIVGMDGRARFEPVGDLDLKGFSRPIAVYAAAPAVAPDSPNERSATAAAPDVNGGRNT